MDENNERPRSLFHNFWGKNFLIFSFILIVVVLVIVVVYDEPEPQDPTIDQKDMLEADSLGEIRDIRDEQQTKEYVQPEDDRDLWRSSDTL